MNFAYNTSGSNTVLMKKYKIGATVSNPGTPLLDTSTGAAGIRVATTTSLANAIGCSVDTATYTTTQSTSMTEGIITCIANSNAVWRSLMSGGATEGTAITLTTNSSASAGGTLVTITTGDPAPNSPEHLDGLALCVSGGNGGEWRGITSTAATTATVTVPFRRTIASGDTFILVPWSPANATTITAVLTTNLYQVRADQDAAGDAAINVVDVEFDTANPRTNSYLHLTFRDHVLNLST